MKQVTMITVTLIAFIGVLNPTLAAQQALPEPLVCIGVNADESPYRLSSAIQRLDEVPESFQSKKRGFPEQ